VRNGNPPAVEQDVVGSQVEVLLFALAALAHDGDALAPSLVSHGLRFENRPDFQLVAVRHRHTVVDLEQRYPLSH
jgi:hypothetical protein